MKKEKESKMDIGEILEKLIKIEEKQKHGELYSTGYLNFLKIKLKMFRNGEKQERQRCLKEFNSFIIGKLYGLNELSTEAYDKIVKLWEELKKEIKEKN